MAFRWMQEPQDEPEQGPKDQRAEQAVPGPSEYSGPWTQRFFRVTLHMLGTVDGGAPFNASYSLVVPDYNMDALLDTLNGNSTTYLVQPIEGGGPIDSSDQG